MIKVLVVEDSPTVREFLVHILSSDSEIQVVATAKNGEEALEAVKRENPDVITMDVHMPKMNGFDATRRIMETQPTPIVIVSGSWDAGEVETSFRALEAGAVAVLPRPRGLSHPEFEVTAKELIQTVKLMSEVKVVRRWPRPRSATALPSAQTVTIPRAFTEIQVVAMGASTGGPMALQAILSRLPKDCSVPVLIVQHMAAGFIQGFVEWLAQSTRLPIQVAVHGEAALPGHVYVAPDGFHMGIASDHRLVLKKDLPENGLCPSVSYLFASVARVFGARAVGVLLTGMGKDGAEELKLMKQQGAVTMAQDQESSVVHGMPGEAIRREAASYVLSPEGIAQVLSDLVQKK